MNKNRAGWIRVMIGLCAGWLAVANALYFSIVGRTSYMSFVDFASNKNTEFAFWEYAWSYGTFRAPFAHLYEVVTTQIQRGEFQTVEEYRLIGHVLFMLYPITLMWAIYCLVQWVSTGITRLYTA